MNWPWTRSDQKSEPQSAGRFVALSQLPSAAWGRADGAALSRDGYAGNAIAYRCVRLIAEAAASIPFSTETEWLETLLSMPSPDDAGRGLFERLYTDLTLTGDAYLEAVFVSDTIEPRGLYAWPSISSRTVRDAQGNSIGFALRTARGERIVGPNQAGWSPVLRFSLYHPGAPGQGLSPLAAARKALDLHNSSAAWAKALIDNAARPSGALIYGRDGHRLSDDQFERLKTELTRQYTGPSNAGRPLLLEGGLDWKPMALSPAEMGFQEARDAAAREIALAFGVPPMLLGIPGDNTYANYREANTAFWRLCVLPLVQRTADQLSAWLSQLGEPVRLRPLLDDVPAFSHERDALWARISGASFLSDAQKRELLGLNA